MEVTGLYYSDHTLTSCIIHGIVSLRSPHTQQRHNSPATSTALYYYRSETMYIEHRDVHVLYYRYIPPTSHQQLSAGWFVCFLVQLWARFGLKNKWRVRVQRTYLPDSFVDLNQTIRGLKIDNIFCSQWGSLPIVKFTCMFKMRVQCISANSTSFT